MPNNILPSNFYFMIFLPSRDSDVDDLLIYDLSLHNRDGQVMTYRQYYVMLRNIMQSIWLPISAKLKPSNKTWADLQTLTKASAK